MRLYMDDDGEVYRKKRFTILAVILKSRNSIKHEQGFFFSAL